MNNLREYGESPFNIVVVHGGPGAPGDVAPVAKELSKNFGVLEPLQTKDSIEGQIQELKEVIQDNADLPVTLIGYSWGAWLSYIFAAKYPEIVKKLILVSSGPFEQRYVPQIMETRMSRFSEEERLKVERIIGDLKAGNENPDMQEFGSIMGKADSFDPLPSGEEGLGFQEDIYKKVWGEAENFRKTNQLLEFGKSIECPVIAIHGEFDPHPWEGVENPLSKVIKNFEFILLKDCGHTPWKEKQARDKFYEILNNMLLYK